MKCEALTSDFLSLAPGASQEPCNAFGLCWIVLAMHPPAAGVMQAGTLSLTGGSFRAVTQLPVLPLPLERLPEPHRKLKRWQDGVHSLKSWHCSQVLCCCRALRLSLGEEQVRRRELGYNPFIPAGYGNKTLQGSVIFLYRGEPWKSCRCCGTPDRICCTAHVSESEKCF